MKHSRSSCILIRVSTTHLARAIGVLAVGCLAAAACGSPSPRTPARATVTGKAVTGKTARPVSTRIPAAANSPAPPPGVSLSAVRTADGSVITVAIFRGAVQYVLHNGSVDPGPSYARLVRAGPVIAGPERQRLLAAFNGGFLMRSHAGGYEQEGHVFRSLRHGLASLVIDRSGHARIGIWGVSVPAPGEAVYSVRQNLWALVQNGRPTAQAARWWRWGGTIGHAEYVARSALGQDPAGDLIYAASMSATPQDLADALARSGAMIGMEMDINPEWVQLDTATTAGGALAAAIKGQARPADQYLTGWTRDFITVLAPSGV